MSKRCGANSTEYAALREVWGSAAGGLPADLSRVVKLVKSAPESPVQFWNVSLNTRGPDDVLFKRYPGLMPLVRRGGVLSADFRRAYVQGLTKFFAMTEVDDDDADAALDGGGGGGDVSGAGGEVAPVPPRPAFLAEAVGVGAGADADADADGEGVAFFVSTKENGHLVVVGAADLTEAGGVVVFGGTKNVAHALRLSDLRAVGRVEDVDTVFPSSMVADVFRWVHRMVHGGAGSAFVDTLLARGSLVGEMPTLQHMVWYPEEALGHPVFFTNAALPAPFRTVRRQGPFSAAEAKVAETRIRGSVNAEGVVVERAVWASTGPTPGDGHWEVTDRVKAKTYWYVLVRALRQQYDQTRPLEVSKALFARRAHERNGFLRMHPDTLNAMLRAYFDPLLHYMVVTAKATRRDISFDGVGFAPVLRAFHLACPGALKAGQDLFSEAAGRAASAVLDPALGTPDTLIHRAQRAAGAQAAAVTGSVAPLPPLPEVGHAGRGRGRGNASGRARGRGRGAVEARVDPRGGGGGGSGGAGAVEALVDPRGGGGGGGGSGGAGVVEPRRAIATVIMLACMPPGTGKTTIAKALRARIAGQAGSPRVVDLSQDQFRGRAPDFRRALATAVATAQYVIIHRCNYSAQDRRAVFEAVGDVEARARVRMIIVHPRAEEASSLGLLALGVYGVHGRSDHETLGSATTPFPTACLVSANFFVRLQLPSGTEVAPFGFAKVFIEEVALLPKAGLDLSDPVVGRLSDLVAAVRGGGPAFSTGPPVERAAFRAGPAEELWAALAGPCVAGRRAVDDIVADIHAHVVDADVHGDAGGPAVPSPSVPLVPSRRVQYISLDLDAVGRSTVKALGASFNLSGLQRSGDHVTLLFGPSPEAAEAARQHVGRVLDVRVTEMRGLVDGSLVAACVEVVGLPAMFASVVPHAHVTVGWRSGKRAPKDSIQLAAAAGPRECALGPFRAVRVDAIVQGAIAFH